MYLKSLVKVPNAPGKLLRQKKADTTYVYYEIDRIYIPEKKNTRPKRVVIGKLSRRGSSRGSGSSWQEQLPKNRNLYGYQ